MRQYWLAVGHRKNWLFALANGPIWGIKPYAEGQALWDMVNEGDGLLIYSTKPDSGIIGCATVSTKFRQTNPLWPIEVRKNEVIYPLRFEFDLEYCLPPNAWGTDCYRDSYLPHVIRKSFLIVPSGTAREARKHLRLPAEDEVRHQPLTTSNLAVVGTLTHDEAKDVLLQIGRIQGFIAEPEYPIEGNRLDAVWRRVQNSVPTYAFEIQVGGDIYHALAKLKHAYDLWNSHVFLVADLKQRAKCEELLSGTFHEIKSRLTFVELGAVMELYKRKVSYKDFEHELGIMRY